MFMKEWIYPLFKNEAVVKNFSFFSSEQCFEFDT